MSPSANPSMVITSRPEADTTGGDTGAGRITPKEDGARAAISLTASVLRTCEAKFLP